MALLKQKSNYVEFWTQAPLDPPDKIPGDLTIELPNFRSNPTSCTLYSDGSIWLHIYLFAHIHFIAHDSYNIVDYDQST